MKCGADVRFGFGPQPAAMVLYDASANSQSNAVARIPADSVKTLEGIKDAIPVLRIEADSMIRHRE